MALTIAIEGLGELDNAEATTNWGISGSGGSAFALDNEIYYQGAGSMSSKISSGKQAWLYYNHGTALNFTTTYSGQYILIWWQVATQGAASVINGAQQGFSVRIGSSTSVYREWRLGGGDVAANGYTGGWNCAVIDPTSAGTNDVGSYSAASVQYIGIHYDGSAASRAENLFVDSIMAGSGIRITGTETTAGEGWQEVVDYCTDRANRAWGFIQQKEQGIFSIYGALYVGDSAQAAVTSLTDSSRIFKFADYQYYDNISTPTLASSISDGFHGLIVEDHASYTTTFKDGIKVGSASGRSGSTFLGATYADCTFDLYGSLNAASLTTLYATILNGITGGITWGNDANHEMLAVTVTKSGQFDPVGAVVIRGCVFSELYDDGTADASKNSAVLWNTNIDMEDCSFIANSHAGSDIAHGIEHPAAGTFSYTDLVFSGNEIDVHFSAATGNLIINKAGTSNPATSTDDSTGTVTIQGSVTTKVTVVDADNLPINLAQVGVYLSSDGTEVMNLDTNASGIASTTFAGTTPAAVSIKVRKSSPGDTRYENFSTTGTIQPSSGLDITVVLTEDTNV